MSTIVLRIGTTDVDPTLVDPENLAADIVDTYNDDLRHRVNPLNGPVELIEAEWEA